MTFDSATISMLLTGTLESLYMIAVSSLLAYVIGIPLGIILIVADKDGIHPMPWLHKPLGIIINLIRSVPFIIFLLMMLPLTRMIVGTTLGSTAVIPPLTLASAPYVARVVESSFKEVDGGIIEAAKSMGASTFQIIWKVYLPEAKPSLLVGAALAITTILGYSAMAGFVGGGGLGDIAIRYGYYKYETNMMLITVAILVIIVQIIQEAGMGLSRKSDKRIK
ncbi:methionine ABC transporter permease [Muricomes intestini]|jgi:D-methionine transport system permease protein|uniref:D-methionine transport system permease protein n=1 Tax=Muricomes intestini TaxID=1796634 RepID=A0A4R3K9E3_9FIRM|nr:methionine ABC transporter permease [Muricomes intestini]TCS79515.1 D-methionine transport system permease protein [Muricomes intestini]HAX53466.1 methionine ABC transporter permease [Lachnospiraceae bacterium]HCR84136.1 methionine ABC transporter permease [Lachnospiraceae bacterium]